MEPKLATEQLDPEKWEQLVNVKELIDVIDLQGRYLVLAISIIVIGLIGLRG